MFGNRSVIFSVEEINRLYPDQWVAITVAETDADGFAAAGEIMVHDTDERFVWSAARLGDAEDLIYVFHTGSRRGVPVTA
jgi:hypothetical protein